MRQAMSGSVLVVLLIAALLDLYVAAPLWLNYRITPDLYLLFLASAAVASVLQACASSPDRWLNDRSLRESIPTATLQAAIWMPFIVFLVVVLITASTTCSPRMLSLIDTFQSSSMLNTHSCRVEFAGARQLI